MDSVDRFILILVAIVAIVAVTVAGIVAYDNIDRNAKMVEMVKAGADPMASRCALGTQSDLICAQWLANYNKATLPAKP